MSKPSDDFREIAEFDLDLSTVPYVRGLPSWTDNVADKVYILWVEGTSYFKVGFARASLRRRLSELQIASPLNIHFIAAAYGSKRDEQALHELLKPLSVRGEWFDFHGRSAQFMSLLEAFGVTPPPDCPL